MRDAARARFNIQRPVAASPSLRRLQMANIKVEEIDSGHYDVAGRFSFWPAINYWRALDGSRHGYDVGALIAAARS